MTLPNPSCRTSWARNSSGMLGLAVQGIVTENFDPEKELRNAQAVLDADFEEETPEVVIDLDGVKRINSVGVKRWVEFIGRLQSRHVIRFSVISSPFVEIAQMIPVVLGKTPVHVTSFRVPYASEHCSHFFDVLGQMAELGREGKWTQLEHPCERCGKPAGMDALPEEYFSFLALCKR